MSAPKQGKVYKIGDEFARVLWVGNNLFVYRTWFSMEEEDYDSPEEAKDFDYAEKWFEEIQR